MKLPFLFVLLACTSAAGAQTLSAGLRAGAGYWAEGGKRSAGSVKGYDLETMKGAHISPDVEAFVRVQRKDWVLDVGVGTSAHRRVEDWEGFYIGIEPRGVETRVRNLEVPLTVQKELKCLCLSACPLLRRVHVFAGATVTPAVSFIALSDLPANPAESARVYSRSSRFTLWTGLTNTVSVDLSRKVSILASGYVRIAPVQFFSPPAPAESAYDAVGKAGGLLGVAWKL